MDNGIGVALLIGVLGWMVYTIWQGYQAENAPPVPLADNGNGAKVPICPKCSTVLITSTRKSTGFIGYIGAIVAITGGIMFLFAPIAGLLVAAFGLLVYALGKRHQTLLTCPACGHDARRLD